MIIKYLGGAPGLAPNGSISCGGVQLVYVVGQEYEVPAATGKALVDWGGWEEVKPEPEPKPKKKKTDSGEGGGGEK